MGPFNHATKSPAADDVLDRKRHLVVYLHETTPPVPAP